MFGREKLGETREAPWRKLNGRLEDKQKEGAAKPPRLSGVQGLTSLNPVIALPVSLGVVTETTSASGRMTYSSTISLKI